ncbi:MAG: BamA/TamA family outer membrane protein [Flavobacterium sp.]|uniref:BamA/TamA family outer membrane protein n=1 Tax=Flavobacterium sp. TaxID=239 RepID=UPI00260CC882|nr:BamA/TamA family outer membrane protein [Flavobacterium sp.]MDD5150673.1 BamA/TamA family outer membrane protein [Flavobacterium sp.]
MKYFAFLLLFIHFGWNCSAQNFHLQLIGSSTTECSVIDSLSYISIHKNTKSISNEMDLVSEKLLKIGYIENQILENTKINDSSYVAKFSLGQRIKFIHIYIGRNSAINDLILLDKKKDSLILSYSEVEPFLNQTLQKLEQKGFALARLKLINIHKQNESLYAELQFESGQQRQINSIVVKYDKANKKNSFPEGHLTQVNRKYHKNTFNKDIVRQIHDDFEKFGFVNQIKYPEILFTKDTTKVYVYLEKRKSNTFDGFIGFSNNEKHQLTFNGYLDLTLENTLRAGEQFSLYWKSNGNNQKTFKASIDLPYLFKSPIGMKAQIHIFKQDSIYQNTKTAIDLGYFIHYNTRIYLGYQSTESSDIQNTNNSTISDYKNSYWTSNLEYSKLDYDNATFSKKSSVSLNIGIGKRATTDLAETAGTSKQYFINLNAMHNFYLNKKNCININYQNYLLKSDTYIINELYRFGGINSIRGFAENSLQANFMTAIISEYRYIASPNLYLHTIIDYGHYEDNSTKNRGNLLGFGLGMGIQTKNGLLKLAFANGSIAGQEIKFYNTIIHISYNVKF